MDFYEYCYENEFEPFGASKKNKKKSKRRKKLFKRAKKFFKKLCDKAINTILSTVSQMALHFFDYKFGIAYA